MLLHPSPRCALASSAASGASHVRASILDVRRLLLEVDGGEQRVGDALAGVVGRRAHVGFEFAGRAFAGGRRGETIERLKKDIADKGIRFFSVIDQSKLAAEAGIKLQPSVLLIFGNPPLGTQFITA